MLSDMTSNISLIIKAILLLISIVSSILGIIANIKKGKWKTLYLHVNAVTDKTKVLMEFMKEAEDHKNFSGSDKLQYVLSKYIMYCFENKIEYKEDEITKDVEQLVALTKEINNNDRRTNQRITEQSNGTREEEQRTSTTNICD